MKDESPRCTATVPHTLAPRKGGEHKLGSRSRRQTGQGMVEYALILVLVSIVVIVILLTMGNQISNVFSNVVAALGA
ncbi:MAG: Flp family type IVb pilin [Chloroflexi bacterium]|nr:MAG: Flp family type IVb pilin [Chloroflexota bacterium]